MSILESLGIHAKDIYRNAIPAKLYELAIETEAESIIADSGALIAFSGEKTGRSPKDKRIVEHPDSKENIWWGDVNIALDEADFFINRERAIDYFNHCERLYVVDGFAGWDPKHRQKIRVVCTRPYHALFMHNMLIRPTAEELKNFGDPDFTILNAGQFPANSRTHGMTSKTSIDLSFEENELVILGTEYAGEMKKGVFTVMNYLMPLRDVLSMHCSVNVGDKGDASIFFGLSGTGKTTLSAEPKRLLVGDDEHCWTPEGLFNIEGGCYAKCIGLSEESDPEIYNAIRFGALMENVKIDPDTRSVDFDDTSITQNTRLSYPIEHITNAKIPCVAGQPRNIVFLTADAFGIFPPVSELTPEQAMYHFINGYTSKIAGTEMGVTEPEATFSPCYGAAFMVHHPTTYAKLLADKIRKQNCKVWMINTGWSGGPYGVGSRIKLTYTRAMVDAIHSGILNEVDKVKDPIFGFHVPTEVPNVPTEILTPKTTWKDPAAFDAKAKELVEKFHAHFKAYADQADEGTKAAAPKA